MSTCDGWPRTSVYSDVCVNCGQLKRNHCWHKGSSTFYALVCSSRTHSFFQTVREWREKKEA